MLKRIIPKLPMSNVAETRRFYEEKLGFQPLYEFKDYLIMAKDEVEIHFFLYEGISKSSNYGMCYVRVDDIENFYESILAQKIPLATLGQLETKSWNQVEFSIVDNSGNLLTFGEPVSEEMEAH